MMQFGLREIAAVIAGIAIILSCSCEKHPLGQDPEVQKERIGESEAGEENAPPAKKSDASETATPKPTPAEFFPSNTPSH